MRRWAPSSRSPAQLDFAAELAGRIVGQGGAALLIDYGRDAPGIGDTLQALAGHVKVDPLAAPGEADLTVHADFPAVLAAAKAAGARGRRSWTRACSCAGWGSRRELKRWPAPAPTRPPRSAASLRA